MESKFFENFNELINKAINSIDDDLLVKSAEMFKNVKKTQTPTGTASP